MSGFTNIAALVDAEVSNGTFKYSGWRKTPSASQATPTGVWYDLSMSPGNPIPQYYAYTPLVAVVLAQSTDGGLFHGGAVSPATKHVRNIMALTTTATPLPMPMMLLDYLLFYSFVDESITDPQAMVNTTTIPRYTTGEGVQIMAVSVGGRAGGSSFTVSYTNSSGVSGRTTQTVIENSVSINGSIVTSDRAVDTAAGPFLPLQTGDTGVRSIQSITMQTADYGLFALVLVKPLCQMQIRGIDAPVEIDLFKDFAQCPVVNDDAYLNFICCPQGSLASVPIYGDVKFVWN